MNIRGSTMFVVAAFSVVASPLMRAAAAQQVDFIVDAEAYRIFSEMVPRAWVAVSTGSIVLQRETTLESICEASDAPMDAEWARARNDFREQNSRTRLLQSLFSMRIPYRLIARAEIEADDARLALKYPGIWQRRPESMEFVAVSAVGFNAAKTKAIVYVRTRSSGSVNLLERQQGQWVRVSSGGCGWIV